MKKRILSIVLAICLVLFCVPITVFAADTVGNEYAFLEVLNKGGTQKLDKDYKIAQSINVGKTIVLDLNGHVVHITNNKWLCVDRHNDGVTLTIKDSKPNEVHSGEYAGLPEGGVICADGKKNGGTDLGDGGCLYVESGTLILESGTICNGYAQGHGGAIANKSNFIMNGGTIENCSSQYGGAVANKSGGTFTMNGGTITNCTATGSESFGGGSAVSLNTYSEMIISGSASIHDNPGKTSIWCAGNIYAHGGTINGDVFLGAPGNQYETFEGVGLISKKDDYTEAAATVFNGNIDNWGGTISYGKFKGEVSNERVCQRTMKITGGTFYAPVTGYGPITGGIFYSSLDKTLTVNGTCYTVSFNLNGGSGSISPQRFVNTKTSRALRPTNPTRNGYVFKGWYNGSTKYTFAEPVTQSITLTAEWINTSVSTETDLKQLIDGGIPSAKLADDITLSSILDLSDKEFTLDLNGHVLKGNINLSDGIQPVNPSKLTLIDSNPTATHTDSRLPLGGVLDGEIKMDTKTFVGASILCANGGTVMGKVMLKDSSTQIGCTSTTPTAFMDYVGNSGEIHGGMFYGGVKESCIEENTVTFLNEGKRYAVGVVEFGQKAVAPVEPVKDGYVLVGWYIGDTKYDFIQPVTLSITLTAKWVNEVTNEDTLREAINAGVNPIKLMSDINLSSALDLSHKDITIDLNGYVISGADISINTGNGKASLTLTDSRPAATHTDSSLPVGGTVTSKISMKQSGNSYNDCVLYANGGTVTSEFNTNTNAVAIKCTGNTPTAFTGKISGYAHLYGGIYYGAIASTVTVEGKKITFQNGNSTYAYEIVDGNKTVSPIVPPIKTGYQAFDGWYNGNTEYTFGSSLSQDITLTAKFSNPLTYNITYSLGGGTATNPATYTVESNDITLNNPTKTGYTFTGWSGTGLSGKTMTVTIPKGSTGDRTYTANFSQNSYTVAFDTVGGSNISDKTGVKWTDQVLSGITAPTKDGWEFTGWKCGNMTVTAGTTYYDLAVNDTVTSVTLVAQWKDMTAPTGEIGIGTNKWNSFLNTITFGLFFKDAQTVTITASDNSGDAVTIGYLLSDNELNQTELANRAFTAYTKTFSINPDNKYVVYAKLTDHAGNVTYISSEGVVLDGTAPVISGIEDGKTYCSAQTVTVSDNDSIQSVTVNGSAIDLVNNQFTLSPAVGAQEIIATDNAGNNKTVTVTVNNGHTYGEWQSNGDGTHTRYCTVNGCNGYEDGDCDGGEASYFNKAVCDTCHAEYGALLTDLTAPTGEISIGTNKWNSFLNTITFGIFFKDTQSVTITASDDSYSHDGYTDDKAVKAEYYLHSGDTALTKTDLAGKEFTEYSRAFNINPDNKYVIYAKLTDHAGNVTYISSEGVVLDGTAPVISGIENGKTYCEAQTVTVTEAYIKSVTVNGTEVPLDANNQFTLNPADGTQTIVATDHAGNSASVTVTVNNGHTYEWQDDNGQYWKKCKFCDDETAKKEIPTITINGADAVCRTQDYKFSFTLPQGATDPVYGYEFENKGDSGLPAIIENNELFGIVPVTEYEPSENSFKVYAGAKTSDGFEFFVSKTVALMSEHTDAATKDHICDICGATLSEHTGGEATCRGKAICEYCGKEYGELAPNSHVDLKHFPVKAATKTAEGNIEYWYCSGCEKYYKDAAATKEIAKADTVIAKLSDDSKSPQTGDNNHTALWIALFFVSGGGVITTTIVSKKKKHSKH